MLSVVWKVFGKTEGGSKWNVPPVSFGKGQEETACCVLKMGTKVLPEQLLISLPSPLDAVGQQNH